MALPMSNVPTYNVTIPSSNKTVKFRPFLVKEEKALLLAQQSEDLTVMIDTLKQVIVSCVEDKTLDVENMPTFDLEYLFSQIRAKSVDEKVELYFKCDTCEDPKAVTKVSIDLTSLKVTKDPKHTSKIALFDDVGVVMKYPTGEMVKKIQETNQEDLDAVFDIIVDCIDHIYSEDEVFYAKEQTREELTEFLNNLTSEQFDRIREFFETMPKLVKEIDYKCPVCNKEHHTVLEGLNSFF